ncbi:hypothetical protein NL676_009991 [Syzygium grande]|nr:hypothetical protein NL676_009991 [Syzygium grande]
MDQRFSNFGTFAELVTQGQPTSRLEDLSINSSSGNSSQSQVGEDISDSEDLMAQDNVLSPDHPLLED